MATRVHAGHTTSLALPAAELLRSFIRDAARYADLVLVAVGADAPHGPALLAHVSAVADEPDFRGLGLRVLPVQPWGSFNAAPAAILTCALAAGCGLLLFQSLEVALPEAAVRALAAELWEGDTLVAGACLEGHAFETGDRALAGDTCPWNTAALWCTARLGALGFPAISETGAGGCGGGVEEVAAVAAAQALLGGCAAKLVRLPPAAGLAWEAEWADAGRAAWHARKMASKRERPAAQLAALGPGVAGGVVVHVDRSAQALPVAWPGLVR